MECRKRDWINPRVNYKMTGKDGPVIILIHGIPSSLEEWNILIPELVSIGYRTISMDLLGHGNSYKPENPRCYTVDVAYSFFEEWLNSIKIDYPIVLIGHSFGGNLSIKYALNNPGKVRALILINPFLSYDQLLAVPRLLVSKPALMTYLYKLIPSWLIKSFVWLGSLRMENYQHGK